MWYVNDSVGRRRHIKWFDVRVGIEKQQWLITTDDTPVGYTSPLGTELDTTTNDTPVGYTPPLGTKLDTAPS